MIRSIPTPALYYFSHQNLIKEVFQLKRGTKDLFIFKIWGTRSLFKGLMGLKVQIFAFFFFEAVFKLICFRVQARLANSDYGVSGLGKGMRE